MAKLLVVDDDELLANMLARKLKREGYEVVAANSGSEALDVAPQYHPDLILLDVMMPEMNGFEVLRKMRQHDALMATPVIMLTALGEIGAKEEGFTKGADDYIVKPFDSDELRLRIEAQLRRYRLSSEHERYRQEYANTFPIVLGQYRSGVFRRGYVVTKRIFDFLACLLALPFALPILGLIALAIRLESPGPVIFVQHRTGLNGKRFKMLKFRSMVIDAPELKEKYEHLNEMTWPDFKIGNDPRVTRVGRFLRKTSLDETPQIFNILKGDMSIVGPRPTSFKAGTYQLWQTERLEVRPGLTGLWQVTGRADVDFEERVELDIEYIERQSWALDLLILYRTFSAVVTGRGAH